MNGMGEVTLIDYVFTNRLIKDTTKDLNLLGVAAGVTRPLFYGNQIKSKKQGDRSRRIKELRK